jgi:predicted transposase YbfD/YdcC
VGFCLLCGIKISEGAILWFPLDDESGQTDGVEKPTVIVIFRDLPDPRVERTRKHKLVDVLLIVLIGTICGCKGWDEIAGFVEYQEETLRRILELPNGIPSADTLRRVITAIDPKAFGKAFIAWAQRLCETTDGKLIAVDGKTVRGAFEGKDGQGALHLINAWVCENQLVLGQHATDVKSNEITAIPELLELLDLRGATVSIDAMGCQKGIAKCIVDKGANYLFGLKGNQPTLHAEVVGAFDEERLERFRGEKQAFHETVDKGHGRLEVRRVWVDREVDWLTRSEQWPKLRTMILVETECTEGERTSKERRAYISSLDETAEKLGSAVRSHWQVENHLHWVLDVTFGEDQARISKKNGAENLALLRKLALNLLQKTPAKKKDTSLAMKRKISSWSFDFLLSVLRAGYTEPTSNSV